jgi:hypothetical protein
MLSVTFAFILVSAVGIVVSVVVTRLVGFFLLSTAERVSQDAEGVAEREDEQYTVSK